MEAMNGAAMTCVICARPTRNKVWFAKRPVEWVPFAADSSPSPLEYDRVEVPCCFRGNEYGDAVCEAQIITRQKTMTEAESEALWSGDERRVRALFEGIATLPVLWTDDVRGFVRRIGGRVDRSVGEAAWQGYHADGNGSQSCDRVHERGGFSFAELGYYIARAVQEGRVRLVLTDKAKR